MIEKKIKNYLEAKFEHTPVLMENPTNDRPDEYIVISVIGRGLRNHINMVTVECLAYSSSNYLACDLDTRLREAMCGITAEEDFFGCEMGGGRQDNDTTLKAYRYRSYWNIYY